MTSVVDKYYRRIIQNIDSVTMKFDISGLFVKSKEHDSKIENNDINIEQNLSIIEDNKINISENLKLIENNDLNIEQNLSLIEDNKSNISENLSLIEDNKSNIANNYNISQINKKKSEFNTTSIDNNIESLKSIKNDIDSYYKLKDIFMFNIDKTQISETVNINYPKFVIIQSSLNNNCKKDSYIEFNSAILIFFNQHYINQGYFHVLLEFLMMKINRLNRLNFLLPQEL